MTWRNHTPSHQSKAGKAEPTARITEGNGMKSEFDKYINLIFQDLGIGSFCLDRQQFIKKSTIDQSLDRMDSAYQDNDQIATDSIITDNIDILSKSNAIENSLDALSAKLDLEILMRNYKNN